MRPWRVALATWSIVLMLPSAGFTYVLLGPDWSYQATPMSENWIVCGTGVPGSGVQRTNDGAAEWNYAHFTFTFGADACQSAGVYPSLNNVNQVDFGGGLEAGVLAETTVWFFRSNPANIIECDMRFSNAFSWYTGTGTPPSTQYDWQSVAIHEMGHCLGLGHQDGITPTPVMAPTLARGETRRALTCDDIAGRDAIYDSTPGSENFELVVPLVSGGLAHYYRRNNPIRFWSCATAVFGSGMYEAVTFIQSDFGGGNFEVIARQGQQLVTFYRDHSTGTWHGPFSLLASGVAGNPVLIQSRDGSPGNFELVVPLASGGLAHYYRPNNPIGPWAGPTAVFGSGVYDAVTLIQSTLGGNFVVVARQGQQLVTFDRDHSTGTWHGPFSLLASGVAGNPVLIQNRDGTPGNFELVVPLASGGLAHYYRPNNPIGPWAGPTAVFGSGVYHAVTLIQSNFGGNFEVVARQGQQLVTFYRDHSTGTWHGPFSLLASEVAGNPVLIQGE
jgi:Matrixin